MSLFNDAASAAPEDAGPSASAVDSKAMLVASVLVIEEEYLIASEIEETLRTAAFPSVELFRSVGEFHDSGRPIAELRLAIIEAKLGAPEVLAFVSDLRKAGIPVVVTSADRAIQSLFIGTAPLDKPFGSESLLAACEAAIRGVSPPEPVT